MSSVAVAARAIELDHHDLAPGIEELCAAAQGPGLDGSRSVVVDVSRLDRLPSTLIAALIWAARRCRARGGSVMLQGAQASVVDQVLRTGLASLLPQAGPALGDLGARRAQADRRRLARSDAQEVTVGPWQLTARSDEPGRIDHQVSPKGLRVVVWDADPAGAEPSTRPASVLVVLLRPGGHAFVSTSAAPPAIHLPGRGLARRVPAEEPSSGDTVLLHEDHALLLCSPSYLHDPPEELGRLRSAAEVQEPDLQRLLRVDHPGAVALVRWRP